MSASTSSFDKKVQHFQRLVHEMAEKIIKEPSKSEQEPLCTSSCNAPYSNQPSDFILSILKQRPEITELAINEAASFCAKKQDALSLHALQYFHAQSILVDLEDYLVQLPSHRSLRLRKSLHITLEKCLYGLPYRFPHPHDAPQPLWNQTLEKLSLLRFENEWKELGHLLYPEGVCQIITKKESGWKIRVIQKLALSKVLGHNHSQLEVLLKAYQLPHLTLWNREPLTSDQIASLIALIPPKKSLEIHELFPFTEDLYQQLRKQLQHLNELNLDFCKKLDFKAFLHVLSPHLRKLSLQGARFEKGDLKKIQMPLLTHLDLSESNINPELLAEIPIMTHLRELSLNRCFDINTLSVELLKNKFPHLKRLILDRCGSLFNSALRQLPSTLSHLSLKWSSGITAEGFEKLAYLRKSLRSFHASHCEGLTENALEALSDHQEIRSLHLDHCLSLSPAILAAYLPRFKHLNDLSLKGLTLHSETWQWLETQPLKRLKMPLWANLPNTFQLPKLEHLDLGKADILTRDGFEYLLSQPALDGLKSLWVENAIGMTDAILPAITRWKNLTHLRIWSDIDTIQLFTASGVTQLGSLENLEHLELSHCGTFDLDSLETLLRQFHRLKSFEFGPLFKIGVEDVKKLRVRLPWIRITCYYYPEISAL